MTRGLVLGKFAPLHRGHKLLIRRSLDECDETVVLVYDSPEVTRISLSRRAGWVRRLFPTAQVIEGHGAPSAVGTNPTIMRLQEDYIRDAVGQRITHFFCSEWYGAHVSAALGAADVRCDPGRRAFPISGTQLRADPHHYREFVSPIVYWDLVPKIVLLGAESTGKSTLAGCLADDFSTTWVPEFGREFWLRHHRPDGTLTAEQLIDLAQGHRAEEEQQVLQARRLLFVDTDARITRLYSRWYHGSAPPLLDAWAEECQERYQLTVLCGDEIPYVEDGTRAGARRRIEAQRALRNDLEKAAGDFVLATGDLAARTAIVRQAINDRGLLNWC